MLPTLEEYIIMIDNHQLGWNDYKYYNEACKQEDLQLRNWLQELRVRRRSCKTYASALKKVNPKSEPEIMEQLIAENEDLKTKISTDRWYSIDEEMPPSWTSVLICCENGAIDKGTYTTDRQWVSDDHMKPIKNVKYWKMIVMPPQLWEEIQNNEKP